MERTVTFTFEDALISPMGFAILSGAGLIDASVQTLNVHATAKIEATYTATGTIITATVPVPAAEIATGSAAPIYGYVIDSAGALSTSLGTGTLTTPGTSSEVTFDASAVTGLSDGDTVLIMLDFYKTVDSGATQLEITPDKFAGYYYLEASTLFRRQDTGADMAAEFVIPNAKIQSSFNFSMASSGDPSKRICLAA